MQYRHMGNHGVQLSVIGLGKHRLATTVEVTWPSGIVQVLRRVRANQVLHVVEAEPGQAPQSIL